MVNLPGPFPFLRPEVSQRSTGPIYKMSSRAGGTPQGHVCVVVGGRVREPSLHFLAHDRTLIDHGFHFTILAPITAHKLIHRKPKGLLRNARARGLLLTPGSRRRMGLAPGARSAEAGGGRGLGDVTLRLSLVE